MSPLFETERLSIRLMIPEDAAFILRLFNAPNWLRFLGDRGIKTPEDARRYIEDVYLKNYDDQGFGAWVVTLKTSGEPIGICGLFQRPYLALPDLGYALLPEFEGMGYAGEAAGATLSYAGMQHPRRPNKATYTQPLLYSGSVWRGPPSNACAAL